jgi:adenylosuccinate lyase
MIERYTLPQMAAVFTDERRYQRWLDVELAACAVMAEDGKIPAESMERIRTKAAFDVQEIDAIEREVNHDVIAFITSVARHIGPDGRFVHQGLTSSDVVDTAFSLTIRDALDIIREHLQRLGNTVKRHATTHARTPMIGRTHGVHAEPTTLGLKFAVWYQEIRRHLRRLAAAREEVAVGKISGAVGNYSSLSPKLEERMLARLDLKAAPVANQILQRDRHAAVMATLSGVASSLEKFALEIRGLARTEIRELEEPFGSGQKGSSAMPHKRNPILCERLCGMARVIRSHAVAAQENVPLWHERDISHSSAERIIFPDAFILLHYMLVKMNDILVDLRINTERMRANLDSSGGLVFSGKVLLALTEAGLSREEAYRIVQGHCARALDNPAKGFLSELKEDQQVTGRLSKERLMACFELAPFLAYAEEILARALAD